LTPFFVPSLYTPMWQIYFRNFTILSFIVLFSLLSLNTTISLSPPHTPPSVTQQTPPRRRLYVAPVAHHHPRSPSVLTHHPHRHLSTPRHHHQHTQLLYPHSPSPTPPSSARSHDHQLHPPSHLQISSQPPNSMKS